MRRKWQVLDIYNAVQSAKRLPLRSEPIIPGTESDLESENAESVYPPPSEDEELEQGTGDPIDPRAVPSWRRPPEPDRPPPKNLESSASASSTAPEPIASSSVGTSSGSHSFILPKATGGRPVFSRATISGESNAGATVSGESHAAVSGESRASAKAVHLTTAPSTPPKVPPKVSQDLPKPPILKQRPKVRAGHGDAGSRRARKPESQRGSPRECSRRAFPIYRGPVPGKGRPERSRDWSRRAGCL